MLQHLWIKDLAVVASADLHFFSGMTVITGETGAGKSILLDALGLALGQRSDSQLIRPHAERAEIIATFDIASLPGAVLWLADLELINEPPEQCMIRRILYTNGRSKAFINGRPVTTQQLRLLGEHLVQIHGQHQHQLLLKGHEQRRIVDAFAQHDALVSQVKTAFHALETCQQQYRDLLEKQTTDHAYQALLQYQIAELDALQFSEEERVRLEWEHDQLAHAQSDRQAVEEALLALSDPESASVLNNIALAIQALKPLHERQLKTQNVYSKSIQECLSLGKIQIEEAVRELHRLADTIEINPDRLDAHHRRLERIYDMARKHKVDPSQLEAHYQQLVDQLNALTHLTERIAQIEDNIQLAQAQYHQVADELSARRRTCAQQLAHAVSEHIARLGMEGAIFTVDCIAYDAHEYYAHGKESVQFGISANPGHPPQPLSKVASGGELSRISLALELIISQYLATPALIFDEVDVGISGKTGAIVGKALHTLGRSAQVFCVTHLPQVAAQGDHHIHVMKSHSANETSTTITTLTSTARIEEIARMLGGIEITEQARAHAHALLQGA